MTETESVMKIAQFHRREGRKEGRRQIQKAIEGVDDRLTNVDYSSPFATAAEQNCRAGLNWTTLNRIRKLWNFQLGGRVVVRVVRPFTANAMTFLQWQSHSQSLSLSLNRRRGRAGVLRLEVCLPKASAANKGEVQKPCPPRRSFRRRHYSI